MSGAEQKQHQQPADTKKAKARFFTQYHVSSADAVEVIRHHNAANPSDQLKAAALLTYHALGSFADKESGFAWPSIESIMDRCLLSERTVRYALRDLERVGLIQSDGRYQNRLSTVFFLPLEKRKRLNERGNCCPSEGGKDCPSEASNARGVTQTEGQNTTREGQPLPPTGANGAPEGGKICSLEGQPLPPILSENSSSIPSPISGENAPLPAAAGDVEVRAARGAGVQTIICEPATAPTVGDGASLMTKPRHPEADAPAVPDEVADYCRAKGYDVDPSHFFDFNEREGWLTPTRRPIKDWRTEVDRWARNLRSKPRGTTK